MWLKQNSLRATHPLTSPWWSKTDLKFLIFMSRLLTFPLSFLSFTSSKISFRDYSWDVKLSLEFLLVSMQIKDLTSLMIVERDKWWILSLKLGHFHYNCVRFVSRPKVVDDEWQWNRKIKSQKICLRNNFDYICFSILIFLEAHKKLRSSVCVYLQRRKHLCSHM